MSDDGLNISPTSLDVARRRDLSAPSVLRKRVSRLDARAATAIVGINIKEKAAGTSMAGCHSV